MSNISIRHVADRFDEGWPGHKNCWWRFKQVLMGDMKGKWVNHGIFRRSRSWSPTKKEWKMKQQEGKSSSQRTFDKSLFLHQYVLYSHTSDLFKLICTRERIFKKERNEILREYTVPTHIFMIFEESFVCNFVMVKILVMFGSRTLFE